MQDPKARLRNELVQRLSQVSSETRQQAELAINPHLRELIESRKLSKIVAYLPRFPGEIDFISVLTGLGAKHTVYFVAPHEWFVTPEISLHQLDLALPLVRLSELGQVDLIIVPGLGFDIRGGRLGRGGGFYDRLLTLDPFKSALKVAICLQLQVVDAVPIEAHDVLVDVLITEEQTRLLPGGV